MREERPCASALRFHSDTQCIKQFFECCFLFSDHCANGGSDRTAGMGCCFKMDIIICLDCRAETIKRSAIRGTQVFVSAQRLIVSCALLCHEFSQDISCVFMCSCHCRRNPVQKIQGIGFRRESFPFSRKLRKSFDQCTACHQSLTG